MSEIPATSSARSHVSPPPAAGAEVTLSREQLAVATERIATKTVRIRRRVITETRTVEVTVRRTVLDIDTVEASAPAAASAAAGDPATGAEPGPNAQAPGHPLVIVLAEEVPQVTTVIRPYERVTIHVDQVADTAQVAAELASERADIDGEPDRT